MHLVALSPEDRRLRFGVSVTDETIAGYVERLDFDRDAVFGVRDDDGALVGVCLLYTSDAADERSSVDLGGRRIIKKKKQVCRR